MPVDEIYLVRRAGGAFGAKDWSDHFILSVRTAASLTATRLGFVTIQVRYIVFMTTAIQGRFILAKLRNNFN